ncbi:MAG TPA: thioredoxin [Egibacteraceae bacterium]|nr:thioredoxin [Egibacteraceae bacterium]
MEDLTESHPVARDATDATFADEVLSASRDRAVVVDFWADWCGPCHQLSPIIERVAARHTDDVALVKVDVDAAPGLARTYQVQGIPAVKAFRDGEVVAEFVGVQPEPAVERFFAALAPSAADRLAVAAAAAEDPEESERLLREALEGEPGHRGAVLALARLLSARDEPDEAVALLGRLPADADAARLVAELRLASSRRPGAELPQLRGRAESGDPAAALELGRALAAAGEHAEALEVLRDAVMRTDTRDAAREAMLEVFALLGSDHPLVREWRPKLASALF